MTLPVKPPLCGENSTLRGVRRKQQCLSAVNWADQQATKKRERRRAICSWSVGYGTLSEYHEEGTKVADSASLLLGRRPRSPPTPPPPLPPVPIHAATATPSAPAAAATVVNPNHKASTAAVPGQQQQQQQQVSVPAPVSRARTFLTMPGLKSLVSRRRNSGSAESSAVPLVRRNNNGGSNNNLVRAAASFASLRKCETMLALTGVLKTSSSSSDIEPIRPRNRLRDASLNDGGSHSRICSRCSSLLSLASTSRYSLDANTGGFVQVPDEPRTILCKLCLVEVPSKNAIRLQQCNCAFCWECMESYVEFEIAQGAYDISCPDAQCPGQGVLLQDEIKRLVGTDMLEKHLKYRLNREVEIDKNRMWCPRAGCETVCNVCPPPKKKPQCVHCPRCAVDFCSSCKLEWHPDLTCEEYNKQLAKQGRAEDTGIPFDSDLIKSCPMCNVPIEKDEGCAQMMCKRCKHVFCWYCLASLDDDFLLRHYDKGPCKNKLGHSRASVIWHRTQVIGIFAGFGILLLVASPLLLLAAPCIVCCKCRVCNAGTTKLDNEEELPGESSSNK